MLLPFNMGRATATPRLYAVVPKNSRKGSQTKTTVNRRRSGCSASNSGVAGGAPGGRGRWGGGRPRTQAPADRARRTHRDDQASDGRRRGTRDNRSTILLVAVPTQVSSFRLLTLSCRYGMLFGSDCNNNTLRDVIGVKRGDTVGI